MDLFVTLNSDSGIPLYRQVVDAIKDAIATGMLKPGDQIPSTRDLACSLGVSRVTTVRAYRELLAQGFLESGFGAGSRISKNMPAEHLESCKRHLSFLPLSDDRKPFGLSEFGRRILEADDPKLTSADLPQLNFGAPPPDLLPVKQWHQLLLKACKEHDPSIDSCHDEVFGYLPLREAIASFISRTRAVHCDPSQIVVFTSSQQALDVVTRLMVSPGDRVVVENPGFIAARSAFALYGAEVAGVPIDDHGMMVERLREMQESVKVIYVTPTHHDPAGVVLPAARRVDLLRYAHRLGAMVIEDDFDSMYKYGGKTLPAIQGIDPELVIYISTFWKALYPLVNFGFVVIPKRYIPVFERAKMRVERTFSVLESMALTELIESGMLDSHVRRTRDIFLKRRQALIFKLSIAFKGSITIPKDNGGTHLLVRFSEAIDSDRVCESARAAGLPMVSTSGFYVSNPRAGEFLIPFAHLEEHQIVEAVAKFAQHLNDDAVKFADRFADQVHDERKSFPERDDIEDQREKRTAVSQAQAGVDAGVGEHLDKANPVIGGRTDHDLANAAVDAIDGFRIDQYFCRPTQVWPTLEY